MSTAEGFSAQTLKPRQKPERQGRRSSVPSVAEAPWRCARQRLGSVPEAHAHAD